LPRSRRLDKLHGVPLQPSDRLLFVRAMLRALRDSNETEALLLGEEISSVGRMPALLPLMEASAEGRDVLRECPRITSETTSLAALRALPESTLGRTYADHLDRCGLDLDALSVPVTRGRDAEANYLLERVRQTHDVWHAVLGLGAAGHEEVLVHAFQWPQLRMPYSALVVSFGTLKHLVGERRWATLRRALPGAYRAGRRAAPLLPVYWERRWEQPLEALRRELRVTPAAAW
jgi:ubiquinone biosynthesis protein COQ4